MPQSKKRRKNTPSRKPVTSYVHLTQHHMDNFERVAHRIMEMAGIDAQDYDRLPKRLRHNFMKIRWTQYKVVAAKGSRVPGAYLKFFNQATYEFECQSSYGPSENKISFQDYILYGVSLIVNLRNYDKFDFCIAPECIDVLERLRDYMDGFWEEFDKDQYFTRANQLMQVLFLRVNWPLYRYYTCEIKTVPDLAKGRMQNLIEVSSFESEIRYFGVQGQKHKGYRLWYQDLLSEEYEPNPVEATVPQVLLEVDDYEEASRLVQQEGVDALQILKVYVQAHVLHRMWERIDLDDTVLINRILSCSIMGFRTINALNGQRLISAIDMNARRVGYFPYVVEDDALLLLSFLPLASPITPEGCRLKKELGIHINDSKYIGLDKASFYVKTDFEKLPRLRDALEKADMFHLTELATFSEFERREDQLLERFFDVYGK